MRDDGLLRIAAHPREGSQPSLRVIGAFDDRGERVAGGASKELALLFFRARDAKQPLGAGELRNEVSRLREFEVDASCPAGRHLDGDWVHQFIAGRSNVKIVPLRGEANGRERIRSAAIGHNCNAHSAADALGSDQDTLHRSRSLRTHSARERQRCPFIRVRGQRAGDTDTESQHEYDYSRRHSLSRIVISAMYPMHVDQELTLGIQGFLPCFTIAASLRKSMTENKIHGYRGAEE